MCISDRGRFSIMSLLLFYFVCFFSFYFNNVESDSIDNNLINQEEAMNIFRLPKTTEPYAYIVKIDTNLENDFKFNGYVEITIVAKSSTNQIVLHSDKLDIFSVSVELPWGTQVEMESFELDQKNQLLLINLKEKLALTSYVIKISYDGILADNLQGFYRSSYVEDGKKKWLATTQFEPTFARRAFPCYDEPKYRAVFTISLAKSHGQIALSNMPVHYTTDDEKNRTWVTFQATPAMPTYLVAFVISDYSHESTTSKLTSVWARKDILTDALYSATTAEDALNEYGRIFDFKYNLPKMDLVVVPELSFPGMENWGVSTFRESLLLANDQRTSKQLVHSQLLLAHEMSHQWLGNLVTPEWWNYVWLHEAFAMYYEYHVKLKKFEEWRLSELFVVEVLQNALYVDGQKYNHPLTTNVQSPDDIEKSFDDILYDKGGSVIRMLADMIGEETLDKSLSLYLNEGIKTGGVVTPSNLLNALEETVNKNGNDVPISEFMRTWTSQTGYPLVTVTRNFTTGRVEFTQKAYQKFQNTDSQSSPASLTWVIPLTYKTSDSDTIKRIFLTEESVSSITVPKSQGYFLLVNIDQKGYYRVNYDSENWDMLIKQLEENHQKIPVLNRAQMVDDSFTLAFDEVISYEIPFRIVQYLQKERDIIPFYSAFNNFEKLLSLYKGTKLGDQELKVLLLQIIEPLYNKIKFKKGNTDSFSTSYMRSTIVKWACKLGHKGCLDDAMKEMISLMNNKEYRISPDVKYASLSTGVRLGSEPEWNAVWEIYKTSEYLVEKEVAISSLACSKNTTFIYKYFEATFGDDYLMKNKKELVFTSVFENKEGVDTGLQFLYDKLSYHLKNGITSPEAIKDLKSLGSMVSFLGDSVSTDKQIELLEKSIELVKPTKLFEFKTSLEDCYKVAKSRVEKQKKHSALIEKAIKKKQEYGSGASVFLSCAWLVASLAIVNVFLTNDY